MSGEGCSRSPCLCAVTPKGIRQPSKNVRALVPAVECCGAAVVRLVARSAAFLVRRAIVPELPAKGAGEGGEQKGDAGKQQKPRRPCYEAKYALRLHRPHSRSVPGPRAPVGGGAVRPCSPSPCRQLLHREPCPAFRPGSCPARPGLLQFRPSSSPRLRRQPKRSRRRRGQ